MILQNAKEGKITSEIKAIAKKENINAEILCKLIAKGNAIIMVREFSDNIYQKHENIAFFENKSLLGIGKNLRTKINANIGTSSATICEEEEIEKSKIAEKYGADTISDLSMGGEIDKIRREIFTATKVPITTVPIYQTIVEKGFKKVSEDDLLKTVKKHVSDGVSSIVLHAGFTYEMLKELKKAKRVMGMVSKGGSFTSAWMLENKSENPFLTNFNEFVEILAEKDVVLSLGNTMRSGCIHDLQDLPQYKEIEKNAELSKIANKKGLQVIVEGMGGHVNPSEIKNYVNIYNKITKNRPLFVAGPLPIDIAVGYDHIAGTVGGALASGYGADYLCYITPSEHLGLPNINEVREGVIAFKIAAHIGDTMKYGLQKQDLLLAKERKKRDWEGQFKYALDCERARELHRGNYGNCTMCGKYCAIMIMERYLG